MNKLKSMYVTPAQMKLLSNSIRTQIMYVLLSEAMTAKQVADKLGESPGNVHYHVQKLYYGGLIELVETKEISGVVEKYYRSKADSFELNVSNNDTNLVHYNGSRMFAYLKLSQPELQELMDELAELLSKWERRLNVSPDSVEIVIDSSIILSKNR
ncbi:transcriptional regulator [Alicyclobacillus sacchari]|nr:winged helix-turn-helix domain-containing protein [Alicyclobacillus sacchari]GMA59311.1 transcriptional regulator [Alicyclobacillus sacchari]